MIEFREPTIGKRIAALRKMRGMRTTKLLAEAIGDSRISEAVIRNIESGRKADLHVSQLLSIAAALKVSPMFLLVPIGLPGAKVDLPNVNPVVAKMTVLELESWLSDFAGGCRTDLDVAAKLTEARGVVRRLDFLQRMIADLRRQQDEARITGRRNDPQLQHIAPMLKMFTEEFEARAASLKSLNIDDSWLVH